MSATPTPEPPASTAVEAEAPVSSGRRGRGRTLTGAAGRVGAGLLLGAVGLMTVALFGPPDATQSHHTDVYGGWVFALLPGAVLLVAVLLHGPAGEEPGSDRVSGARAWGFPASLAALAAFLLFMAWVNEPEGAAAGLLSGETRLVSSREAVLWAGNLTLAVGALLLACGLHWPRARPWRRSLPPVAAGVVLALLAGILIRAAVLHQPTEHVPLAEAVGEPSAVPEQVTRVGWTWDPPGNRSIRSVEPGSHGPVVFLDDGVVALDGSTGEERWSFRHPGGLTESVPLIGGTDGEQRVRVVLHPSEAQEGSSETADTSLVTDLDAVTGEIIEQSRARYELPEDRQAHGQLIGNTPDAAVYFDNTRSELRIVALEHGSQETLWEYAAGADGDPEQGCEARWWADDKADLVHGDQLLLAHVCGDPAEWLEEERPFGILGVGPQDRAKVEEAFTASLVSLDLNTGEVTWVREWDDPAGAPLAFSGGPVMNAGARAAIALYWNWEYDGPRTLDPEDGSDIGTALGEVSGAETHFDGRTSILRADSEGMVVRVHQDDGSDLFHRVVGGEVVGTVRFPSDADSPDGENLAWQHLQTLAQGVVVPGLDGEGAEGSPFVLAGSFEGEQWRIPVEDGLYLQREADQDDSFQHRLVPGPGSVVSYHADVASDTSVHGLVP